MPNQLRFLPVQPFLLVALTLLMTIPFMTDGRTAEEIGVLKENGIRNVTALQAATLVEQRPDIVILDIRTPAEYRQSHIEGAINIDYNGSDFKQKIDALVKDKFYLVHCRSGARSGRAMPILQSVKLENIIHMDRGFNDWQKSGLPVSTN